MLANIALARALCLLSTIAQRHVASFSHLMNVIRLRLIHVAGPGLALADERARADARLPSNVRSNRESRQ